MLLLNKNTFRFALLYSLQSNKELIIIIIVNRGDEEKKLSPNISQNHVLHILFAQFLISDFRCNRTKLSNQSRRQHESYKRHDIRLMDPTSVPSNPLQFQYKLILELIMIPALIFFSRLCLIDSFSFRSSTIFHQNVHVSRFHSIQQHRQQQQSSKLFATMSSDPSVTSLLDGEQEQVIVNRATFEEELLSQSEAPRDELLMATEEQCKESTKWIKKVLKDEARLESRKSSGGGGGFGGGNSKTKKGGKKKASSSSLSSEDKTSNNDIISYNKFNPIIDKTGHGAILQQNGVARINNVLSSETSRALVTYIDEEKLRSEEEVSNGSVPQLSRFTRVLLKSNRCDLLLPFDTSNDVIMQALYELLGDGTSKSNMGAVGSIIESTLSSDAELYEFASLISDPGSDRQVIHPDIAHQGETQKRTGPLLTCFVAIQDIDQSMGPSEFLPHTNTAEYHRQLNDHSLRDDMLKHVPSKISLLNEGDCSIFDATTLHAGTANRSDKRRRLFYFTFRSLAMDDPRTWNNPGSIRPEVKESQLSLKKIREEIQNWRQTRVS